VPDIYEDLARSYLGQKRYVFPTSRRCRVSETAAVLDRSTPLPDTRVAAIFPDIAAEKEFKDVAAWYLEGAAERAAAQEAPEPEPDTELVPVHVPAPLDLTEEFLAAAPDFPDLVAPLPEADPEGEPL
jgi:hypothetical protein